jgi:hypothetical protein
VDWVRLPKRGFRGVLCAFGLLGCRAISSAPFLHSQHPFLAQSQASRLVCSTRSARRAIDLTTLRSSTPARLSVEPGAHRAMLDGRWGCNDMRSRVEQFSQCELAPACGLGLDPPVGGTFGIEFLLGACRVRATKMGRGERRLCLRGHAAQPTGARPAVHASRVFAIRSGKRGVHDAVIAVGPKPLFAIRKQQVVGQISGGIGPKYRCGLLGIRTGLGWQVRRRWRGAHFGSRRASHRAPLPTRNAGHP